MMEGEVAIWIWTEVGAVVVKINRPEVYIFILVPRERLELS
jgi:hypothetical protein